MSTQPLPLNLPFVNKTQGITGRYNYTHNLFKKYYYSKSSEAKRLICERDRSDHPYQKVVYFKFILLSILK